MSEFRVIIAGSRGFTNYQLLEDTLDKMFFNKLRDPNIKITIVSGAARGADKLGEQYAINRGFDCAVFPADWDVYGKAAGYKRNIQMAENADALIAFWDGQSRGTGHMINIMKAKNLPVRIIRF